LLSHEYFSYLRPSTLTNEMPNHADVARLSTTTAERGGPGPGNRNPEVTYRGCHTTILTHE
jgi:hypothetical protein